MYLKKLKLANFKNHEKTAFEFSSKLNCFIGNNGVGKTNLLDAIHYLSFCKSYFNYQDSLNIRHEADFFAIHGDYNTEAKLADKVSCIQQRGSKKQFKLNDEEYDRLADHIGQFPLVMISPYDRDMINEGSETRRRFLDSVISQFNKLYLDDLIKYNKSLQQRNQLLKQFAARKTYDQNTIAIWEDQMVKYGERIHQTRKQFTEDFKPFFQDFFSFISGGKEQVSVTYQSQLSEKPLEELFAVSGERDLQLKYTTCGTHRDDLLFNIEGYPVKKFGSQGQQKSFVVAIRLAQYEYTRKIKSQNPILLLDDIFDKLDADRVQQIIHLVGQDRFGQVFITDTQRDRIENIFQQNKIEHKIFIISNGDSKEIDI